MQILGIESSCDETGVALVETTGSAMPRLLSHALYSQIEMHQAYGGVVPELASRDHIRRVLPLTRQVLAEAGATLANIDVVAYTRGPGLAGALLVGSGVACALAASLGKPVLGVHHLEGHLLSPFLSADPPEFPFIALLVSGGHTQLMRVDAVGRYELLGETIDDAAGEAFDKSAKLMGLPYPGGPGLSRLAEQGNPAAYKLPRPLLHSGDLDFSFAGLKTAVLTQSQKIGPAAHTEGAPERANLAASTQAAIVEVLVKKSMNALKASFLVPTLDSLASTATAATSSSSTRESSAGFLTPLILARAAATAKDSSSSRPPSISTAATGSSAFIALTKMRLIKPLDVFKL